LIFQSAIARMILNQILNKHSKYHFEERSDDHNISSCHFLIPIIIGRFAQNSI